MTGNWVPPPVRDQVVDWVRHWSEGAEITTGRLLTWLGISSSKYYDWQSRYGQAVKNGGITAQRVY